MATALEGSEYKKILLQETSHELEEKEEILGNKKLSQEQAEAMLHKLDEGYQRTRLVNAAYWKQLRELLGELEEEKITQVQEIQ